MIHSMTAFSQREIKGTWGTAAWELRSLNQRYLEIQIRLPEQFRSLESAIRERIRLRLTRGKVECNLRFDVNPSVQSTLLLNKKLAKELVEAAQWVKLHSQEGKIDPLAILRWPGVMSVTEPDFNTVSTEFLSKGFDQILDEFINARESEGNTLKTLIEKRLVSVMNELQKIRQQMPRVLVWQHEKLRRKLEEAQIHLDTNRLEQELVMLAQRIDVSEELERLDAHVKETYQILTKKEAVGRRLDFMMQEFHRESNTLASKSINTNVTASAIELKVLIEQMREQIQNIE
ncbi:YicC/YloC family endoribonuclease [Candidatus Steffania adelgidicola]|uniref:YicC/YloC family endoribonuclease n=1 Tax=Candidatus Steffania adelgidicola TaxID=1076626 RepID=UPI001D001FB9|nr:YicC/YloC family endoribonuclease [Candidatus Steffania adelgidicola]UDG79832.1 hypothetical protein GFK82_00371 [Candidatus Steffania adelgidicola]